LVLAEHPLGNAIVRHVRFVVAKGDFAGLIVFIYDGQRVAQFATHMVVSDYLGVHDGRHVCAAYARFAAIGSRLVT